MQTYENRPYIIVFADKAKPSVVLTGLRDLARFKSTDLYDVVGLYGRPLSEAEMDEWERLADLYYGQRSK